MLHLKPVDIDKVYRLFNIGSTPLVGAAFEGDADVMPATWITALNYDKVTAVIDASHYTRRLIEKSGYFALTVPSKAIVRETLYLGSVSKNDAPDKLAQSGAKFFSMPGFDLPLVEGGVGFAVFRVIPEPHNEKAYDLFIGECVAAWADERVFTDGHWHFESADDSLRTLHYVAGGHFYTIGDPLEAAL